MFQFPGFASLTLWIQVNDTWFIAIPTNRPSISQCQVGFPIRRSTDQSPFPAPRGLSQGITSFIASCCQGIHQTPFSRLIRFGKSKASSECRKLLLPVPGRPGMVEFSDLERLLHCQAQGPARRCPHLGRASATSRVLLSSRFQTSAFRRNWWSVPESNRWPPECKSDALPTELTPRKPGGSRRT